MHYSTLLARYPSSFQNTTFETMVTTTCDFLAVTLHSTKKPARCCYGYPNVATDWNYPAFPAQNLVGPS
jgi:hypothetical protein